MKTMTRAKVKTDDPPVEEMASAAVVETQDDPPESADPQTDAVPIAEAMEQAAAELAADAPTDAEPPIVADEQGQGELFPPPPAPPFDFEKAYEDLARADIRARNKKSTWEACKRGTKDAREEYDEALDDLHNLFIRIDQEQRNALRQVNTTAAMGVAFAAVAEQQNANTEGGGDEMTDETTETEPVADATGTTEAPTTDAPTEDLDQTIDGEGDE